MAEEHLGSRYKIRNQIGAGTYGSVHEAIDRGTGNTVAVKTLRALFEDPVVAIHLLREISILRTLDHPNIIKVLNVIVPENSPQFESVHIIMEHAATDLKKLSRTNTFLTSLQARFLMYQAVCGCRYMHSANILHRDLKPANILLNPDGGLKICDFGLSRSYRKLNQFQDQINTINQETDESEDTGPFVKMNRRMLTEHVVTRMYRAPEIILLEKEYGKAMEVWSLGCVFAELLQMVPENCPDYLSRAPLFPGTSCFPLSPDMNGSVLRAGYLCSETDQLNMIFNVIGSPHGDDLEFLTDEKALMYINSYGNIPPTDLREFLPGASDDELDLLSRMLTFSPKKRITLDEAIHHPCFENMNRLPDSERLAPQPANFEFDNVKGLDTDRLRSIFLSEVQRYNNQ